MNFRLAKALEHLRDDQLNILFPGRDKTSDGWIGDAAHASRSSDHNPWVTTIENGKKIGIVTAIDIDEDLSINIHSLRAMVDSICASKDPRVKYLIYERRITVKNTNLQQWKKYTGKNAHEHHLHISVFPDKSLYDNISDWSLDIVMVKPIPSSNPNQYYIVESGNTLWGLARKFATDVDQLKALNGLHTDVLQIGQQLRIK